MKKIIITIGLSSDMIISKDIVKQIGRLAATVAPLAENKIVGVISTENNEAKICSEIMRQILELVGIFKDPGYKNSFSYQGNSTDILNYEEWREFIAREFQYYEILVVICRDHKRYWPNQIKAQHSFFQFGVAVEFEQLFFN